MRIKIVNDGNSFCAELHAILKAQSTQNLIVGGIENSDVVISSHLWKQESSESLRATRRMHPEIPLLVIVDQVPDDEIRDILGMGASGILLQETVSKHIVWAIPAILNGLLVLPPEISDLMISDPAPSPRACQEQSAREKVHRLSHREREVLELIGRGLSNRQIAASLFISPETVKDHVRAIRTKLDVASRIHAARVAWLARDTNALDAA
ncbi:LuxR C-terminal-related transcriptional regulator [Streptomyces chartreusis]|uniref:helix-turn-helix transcriptional regulator n=1 Tax=Streptomyces chartreusis TaxID=1969 RepID=UPI0036DAABC1